MILWYVFRREPTLQEKRERQNNFSEQTEGLEISDFHQFLTNFSTLGGSRKLSMGVVITFKVFKSLH